MPSWEETEPIGPNVVIERTRNTPAGRPDEGVIRKVGGNPWAPSIRRRLANGLTVLYADDNAKRLDSGSDHYLVPLPDVLGVVA